MCFAACIAFQTWEFVGSHHEPARARSLFKSVRAGWVKVGLGTITQANPNESINPPFERIQYHIESVRGGGYGLRRDTAA